MPSDKRQRKRENAQARAAAERAARRRAEQRRRAITIGILGVIVAAVVAFLVVNSSGGKSSKTTATPPKNPATTATTAPPPNAVAPGATVTGDTPCPKPDGSSARTTKFSKPPPMCIDTHKQYTATMTTDVGVITIALDPVKAPMTVNNFVVLARYHYFDGIVFHRVIPDFVDQGGDPTATGTGGPGYMFADELPQPGDYKAGSLAMANSGPNTNGSQFFLVVSDSGAKTLVSAVGGKANYTLYGQITGGLDIALKINGDGSPEGTPKVLHRMKTVTINES